MTLASILLLTAGILYSTAFFNALIPFLTRKAFDEKAFYLLCLCGFFVQTISLGLRMYQIERLPISNTYELFESIAWLVIAVDIFTMRVLKIRMVGFLGAGLAALFTLLPLLCPAFDMNSKPSGVSLIANFHGAFAGVSYALMALSFIFSLMLILQIRSLHKKSFSRISTLMPSIIALEKWNMASWRLASFTMLICFILGIIAWTQKNFDTPTIVKLAAALIIFSLQIFICIMSQKNLFRGRALAIFIISIFLISILLLFPIEYRTFAK